MFIALDEQARINARAKQLAALAFPEVANRPGGCLYRAAAMVYAARELGQLAILQAGSMLWRFRDRLAPEVDTFGYEWSPASIEAVTAMLQCQARQPIERMPEMHTWAVVRRAGVAEKYIVDPSAGEFPAQCKALIGQEWELERPPEVLWQPISERLRGNLMVARAEAAACALATWMLVTEGARQSLEAVARDVPIARGAA